MAKERKESSANEHDSGDMNGGKALRPGATGSVFDDGRKKPVDPPAELNITDPEVIRMVSNPTRLMVVEELFDCQEPHTATQLAELVGVSPSSMSYHLRLLGKAGIVRRVSDVTGDGRECPWVASASSIGIALSQQEESTRMRVMDGMLRAMRMRISRFMTASAAVPIDRRREMFPFMSLDTGSLILTHEELLEAQSRIVQVWEEYLALSRGRRASDYPYRVTYAWSCLPSGLIDEPDGDGDADGGETGGAEELGKGSGDIPGADGDSGVR
ncbi:ArsR/SmtB family transcription factor [Bifidobacterium leontopitheci]|uniref:Helix-turn-helix domain-containing protein n=1 Tax=Bifidobacterium leontopitheci TaxID=2650774 RepID=A0A6I1GKS7_9BIFI|nr:helix-turn-helix domain-containing protein [Bifidobacterium leontopitheci]KAB7790246.1 Helix-turn-helix domain-containing protein [Bifidobacterium leontopitheci]